MKDLLDLNRRSLKLNILKRFYYVMSDEIPIFASTVTNISVYTLDYLQTVIRSFCKYFACVFPVSMNILKSEAGIVF